MLWQAVRTRLKNKYPVAASCVTEEKLLSQHRAECPASYYNDIEWPSAQSVASGQVDCFIQPITDEPPLHIERECSSFG